MEENHKNNEDEYLPVMRRTKSSNSKTIEEGKSGNELNTMMIAIDKLENYSKHPFQTYEGERLEKFVENIKIYGLLEPIIVRPLPGNRFEILSGHNRVKAAKELGWSTISAIIKKGLLDEAAEQIVIMSNLNQQSFADWSYTQQIMVIKFYSKYIQENSEQGKRYDLVDNSTCVPNGHKLSHKPKRPKSRDKISKQFGISSTVFERYRSIAKLDDEIINNLGKIIDDKRLGFMSAYRISQLRKTERKTILLLLNQNPDVKFKGKQFQQLYEESKKLENEILDENIIREILFQKEEA